MSRNGRLLAIATMTASSGALAATSRPPHVFTALAKILSPRAISAVFEALEDREPGVRAWAVKALARLEVRTDEALAALGRALADEDVNVSRAAARALEPFGQRAVPAIRAALERAFRTAEPFHHFYVARIPIAARKGRGL